MFSIRSKQNFNKNRKQHDTKSCTYSPLQKNNVHFSNDYEKKNIKYIQMVQRRKYPVKELPKVEKKLDVTTVKGYNLPKRMVAKNLNCKSMRDSGSRVIQSSSLGEDIDKIEGLKSTHYYCEGHLLNHKLGGVGKPFNVVTISVDANHQMSCMENAIIKELKQEDNFGAVADYDVTVNYGRKDGKIREEKAIPTSWDMRYTMKKKEGGNWIDDGSTYVQNVKIHLLSNVLYKETDKYTDYNRCIEEARTSRTSSSERIIRDSLILDSLIVKNENSINRDSDIERERRDHYKPFIKTEIWKRRKRYPGEKDIVSAELVDREICLDKSPIIGLQRPPDDAPDVPRKRSPGNPTQGFD